MSMFQNTENVDARGATFNNVGRDQIIADQLIINPNSLGAIQDHFFHCYMLNFMTLHCRS